MEQQMSCESLEIHDQTPRTSWRLVSKINKVDSFRVNMAYYCLVRPTKKKGVDGCNSQKALKICDFLLDDLGHRHRQMFCFFCEGNVGQHCGQIKYKDDHKKDICKHELIIKKNFVFCCIKHLHQIIHHSQQIHVKPKISNFH